MKTSAVTTVTPGSNKRRNFKSLKLDDDLSLPPHGQENISARVVPKRIVPGESASPRRSPLSLIITPNTHKFRPEGLLGLTPESAQRSALHASLAAKLVDLESSSSGSWKSVRNVDLRVLSEIGYGTGGSVYKVEYIPSGRVIARKSVIIEGGPSTTRKSQLLLEIQLAHSCASPYLVSSYGAFMEYPGLMICMEYMDLGSFDKIYKKLGRLDIGIVAHVTDTVLRGLVYLFEEHNVLHRDVKPSNILLNSTGEVKLCDFGVCQELEENNITTNFVGTSVYMSPERMQGIPYTVKSDVWSVGLCFIELVHGRFPFADPIASPAISRRGSLTGDIPQTKIYSPIGSAVDTPITSSDQFCIIELMHQIVSEPPPFLDPSNFSVDAQDFVRSCLEKDVEMRLPPQELLSNVWLAETVAQTDLKAWAKALSESL